MIPVLCSVLALASPFTPACASDQGSYLYQPAFCLDDVRIVPAEPYLPQPGDIMLRLDSSVFWRVTHYVALAFDPNGSGIVFAARRHPGRPGGRPQRHALGGHARHAAAPVRVRRGRPRVDPPPQVSADGRAVGGADGVRDEAGRQVVRTAPAGGAADAVPLPRAAADVVHGQAVRRQAQLLLLGAGCEACVAAGLLDPERTRPRATYPRDLFFGTSYNPFIDRHLDVNEHWHPPARCRARDALSCGTDCQNPSYAGPPRIASSSTASICATASWNRPPCAPAASIALVARLVGRRATTTGALESAAARTRSGSSPCRRRGRSRAAPPRTPPPPAPPAPRPASAPRSRRAPTGTAARPWRTWRGSDPQQPKPRPAGLGGEDLVEQRDGVPVLRLAQRREHLDE